MDDVFVAMRNHKLRRDKTLRPPTATTTTTTNNISNINNNNHNNNNNPNPNNNTSQHRTTTTTTKYNETSHERDQSELDWTFPTVHHYNTVLKCFAAGVC